MKWKKFCSRISSKMKNTIIEKDTLAWVFLDLTKWSALISITVTRTGCLSVWLHSPHWVFVVTTNNHNLLWASDTLSLFSTATLATIQSSSWNNWSSTDDKVRSTREEKTMGRFEESIQSAKKMQRRFFHFSPPGSPSLSNQHGIAALRTLRIYVLKAAVKREASSDHV